MKNLIRLFPLVLLTLAFPACGDAETNTGGGDPKPAAASFPDGLFVDAAPEGAIEIADAVMNAKDGQEIVVSGRIGGRKKVFVDSRAIMLAIDNKLKHCPDEEGCPTPWDYCCDTPETLLANTISVQVVDEKGAPLEGSLEGVHGLKPLAHVVIAGSVKKAGDSVVLNATKIFVKKG